MISEARNARAIYTLTLCFEGEQVISSVLCTCRLTGLKTRRVSGLILARDQALQILHFSLASPSVYDGGTGLCLYF
jgi:hypothetical protein